MKIRVSPREGFTLIELLVVISIIAILAGIALPAFTSVIEKGNQTKVLSNAKQIYLSLKLFAGDYDGVFPTKEPDASGNLNSGAAVAGNANAIFRNLIPAYVQQEKIFHVPKSGWCNANAPDEQYDTLTNRLAAGENHFAYVRGLNDTSNPNYPLLADGLADGDTTKWASADNAPGAIWKGKSAIVVRVDGSGKVEKLNTSFALEEQAASATAGSKANIFTPTANWMGTSTVVVNPIKP